MKIAAFFKNYDGRPKMGEPTNADRLTFEMFKQVHPGRLATPDEVKAFGLPDGIRPGFSVWRRNDGEMMAIRDE